MVTKDNGISWAKNGTVKGHVEALDIIARATEPTSVGLLGNAAEILPQMVARGIRPDAVTDQTSAHDPANGYCPAGWSVAKWIEMREREVGCLLQRDPAIVVGVGNIYAAEGLWRARISPTADAPSDGTSTRRPG